MTIELGPEIPHRPGDPCPFPDAVGVIYFSWGWQGGEVHRLGSWAWRDPSIRAYRLPADHHAYGPKKSSQTRAPDAVANVYSDGILPPHVNRSFANRWAASDRQGVWNVYLKGSRQ